MGAAAILESVEWGACLVPEAPVPAAMAAEVRRRIGATPGWLPRLAPLPWLVRALTELVDHPVAFAPPALCDLVALAVSQDNSCRYCYGIQRAVLRIHGYRDEQIDRLVRDAHMGDLTAGERAALDFARRLTRSNPRPGRSEHDAVVAAGLSPIVVAEVGAIAAAGNFANRVATLLALPAEPLAAFVQSRVFRVVRPLMAWRMRPRPKAPEPLPHPNDGPCARLVAALDGSPSARVLRHIIDDALASPVLPRRTKMLMLAVVGKALGCRYAQQEARDQLVREGFAAADLDEILVTLASPRLDRHEARLVPYARETVRYQPTAIQERTRDVCRGFTAEETLETVGIVALANAVCRLSVMLDAC